MSNNGAEIETVEVSTPEERQPANAAVAKVPKKSAIVKVPLNIEQATKEWENYLALCQAILEEQDYIYFVRHLKPEGYEGKPIGFRKKADAEAQAKRMIATGTKGVEIGQSKKRSAWDKLAKFYNLTLPATQAGPNPEIKVDVFMVGESIVEKRSGDGFTLVIYQHGDNLEIIKATATVIVSAPNGRTAVGEGVCSVKERQKGADSFAHADHDIPSTAFTRALNRAISRCLGTGEVSADEIEGETTANAEPAAEPPKVATAPNVEALPAVATSRYSERTEATPPQAAPVVDAPRTVQPTPNSSPQTAPVETSKQAEAPAPAAEPQPTQPPATSAPVTVEKVAEKFGATVVETKDAEAVRTELAARVNVLVREILPKSTMKNIAATVQSFMKICANISHLESVKKIPTVQLQTIVGVMDSTLARKGEQGLADMILDRNKQGRSAS